MTKILDAKSIIDSKISELSSRSQRLTASGLTPNLAVIIVGENPASLLYVKNKQKFCENIGAQFNLIRLPHDVVRDEFLYQINRLNNDPLVTGCFVQLPVPKQLSDINITQLINPKKDVDGFHLQTVNKLYMKELDGIIPCTPRGIVTLLNENNIDVEGKDITVIGRSHIVGKPLTLLLQALNATVTMCHSKTKNLNKHTKSADIIISAVGIPHLIKSSHLSSNKNQIIIDVGMNKLNGKTVGDVHFDEVKNLVQAITPVPGGVGPMTVFSLMENLLTTTENILNKD
ncbi:MAG: methylenetetrahydrofolate dehydrogenase (NADP+)/methenyltetrahydrofolate cyclohydrolase [Bacteriovoracaceae bacterium]|jgi:methylenetetrahydrofolate dehydrogenase (NADP+)/methenyltetrahydrofolate cyclohydrolase